MNESKLKRIIVATTVGAVMLLVMLLSIMVFQLISIQVKNNEIAYLKEQIALYEQMTIDGEETIEARSTREWIEREARRLGYNYLS